MLRLRWSTHHRHHIRVRIRHRLVSIEWYSSLFPPSHHSTYSCVIKPTLILGKVSLSGLVLSRDRGRSPTTIRAGKIKKTGGIQSCHTLVDSSRFPNSTSLYSYSARENQFYIPLSVLRHRACRSFCFCPSLSRKSSFVVFSSRLRERNVKREREREKEKELMRHTTTRRRGDVRVLLCL